MKNAFYNAHSKAVIKNHFITCLGGNLVIMWNENYDGFYLKTVLFPKLKPYLSAAVTPSKSTTECNFSLDLSPSSPASINHSALARALTHSAPTHVTNIVSLSLEVCRSSPPSSSPSCRHSLRSFCNCSFECILLFVYYSLWVWSLFGIGIVFKTFSVL